MVRKRPHCGHDGDDDWIYADDDAPPDPDMGQPPVPPDREQSSSVRRCVVGSAGSRQQYSSWVDVINRITYKSLSFSFMFRSDRPVPTNKAVPYLSPHMNSVIETS